MSQDKLTYLPSMHPPPSNIQPQRQQYYLDTIATREIFTTTRQVELSAGHLITIKTDHVGRIVSVTPYFSTLSGYSLDEVQNMPMCLLRHPDMPKLIYQQMWHNLNQGLRWEGYVKNLCKDGSYLWVNLTINSFIAKDHRRSFIGTFHPMNKTLIRQYERVYAYLREKEV